MIIKNNDKDGINCNLVSSEKERSAGIEKLINILKEISEQSILNSTKLYDKSLGENDFILGYESGKFYLLCNSKNIKFKYIQEIITKVIDGYEEKEYTSSKSVVQPNIKFNFKFSINDFYRVCAKIAFNYLASKKGQNYVLDEKFDKLRAFILNENGKNNCGIIKEKLPFSIDFPENSHKIFLNKDRERLYAIVSIYGATNVFIELCKYDSNEKCENIFDEGFYGYICDWESRKEYDLIEYIGIINSNFN